MTGRGPARPGVAGVGVALVAAGLLAAWWASTDGYRCESTSVGGCLGPVLVVAALGVPLGGWLAVLVLRAAGVTSTVTALLVVAGGTWALVASVGEAVEPPLAVWPVVAGALAAAYAVVESRQRAG